MNREVQNDVQNFLFSISAHVRFSLPCGTGLKVFGDLALLRVAGDAQTMRGIEQPSWCRLSFELINSDHPLISPRVLYYYVPPHLIESRLIPYRKPPPAIG